MRMGPVGRLATGGSNRCYSSSRKRASSVRVEAPLDGVELRAFVASMLTAPHRWHIVNTSSEAGLVEAQSGFLYRRERSGRAVESA